MLLSMKTWIKYPVKILTVNVIQIVHFIHHLLPCVGLPSFQGNNTKLLAMYDDILREGIQNRIYYEVTNTHIFITYAPKTRGGFDVFATFWSECAIFGDFTRIRVQGVCGNIEIRCRGYFKSPKNIYRLLEIQGSSRETFMKWLLFRSLDQ